MSPEHVNDPGPRPARGAVVSLRRGASPREVRSRPRPERRDHGTRLALVAALFSLIAACSQDPKTGWSSASAYPNDVASVAVPIIENDTFARGLEFQLSSALIREIEAQTPYTVATQVKADTILTARITKVEMDQISKSRFSGLGQEVIVSVTIDFEWRDLRTDVPRVVRREFTGHGLFAPSAPDSERLELGQIAAVQTLAQDVVATMRSDW